ncbi:MAG TPA: DNA repair protein RecN [Casimicrobiaceae bacterium]|jgi:DNA repair protein RecN (Recombination protein N)|nr:DNA repair protein RecN [Casimicrobiaceae bacterium]HWD35698.1 DNA repair protein RecN [Casimicrobiaceae bacterium]
MLRALSIRDFVVVESLDVDFAPGFTVLTGETGAGKSILLDALALLLGDRFEARQLRPGVERAELAAMFDVDGAREIGPILEASGLDAGCELLLRRVLDVQGRSRAFVNGRAATLAQLGELGAKLLDLHGQHAHQALARGDAQRALLDAFAGLSSEVDALADAWRNWRDTLARRDRAADAEASLAAEREVLEERRRALADLAMQSDEWTTLGTAQRRLANAAALIEATTQAEEALSGADDAIAHRLARVGQQLTGASRDDPALADIVALLAPASIQLDEAARALRDYRRRLDLDPSELERVEARLSAMHELARKYRVRPEALPELAEATDARLAELAAASDTQALALAVDEAKRCYEALAVKISEGRATAARDLSARVTAAMQALAMAGGRFDVALEPLATPASHGRESVTFVVATHPKQAAGPLSRVASGGELSRVALAIQVAASEVGDVDTLVFDEVDTGIGGAVAATVGRMLQSLGARRQVLCVTHLPQVAAHADHHFRVVKRGHGDKVTSELSALTGAARVDELARMLAGHEITAKTRAHARELLRASARRQK